VFNARTGAKEWETVKETGLSAASAPVVYLDTSTGVTVPLVYAAFTYKDPDTGLSTGRLVRLRANGSGGAVADLVLNIGTQITSSPALSAGMDQVMVGYTDGADGHVLITDNPRLSSNAPGFTPLRDVTVAGEPVKAPPVLSGDGRTMIIGSSDGSSGRLLAVRQSNMNPLWETPMGGVETSPWVDYEAYANAAQADTVFVGGVDGMIHSLDIATGEERAGYPVRPVPGPVGGSLMVLNRKLYVGCDLGMLVMDPVNPTDLHLFTPAYAADAIAPPNNIAIAPGFNGGMSASGRTPGQSVIALLGSDGRMYEMYVQ
jgi:hypothetical protein